ncbi:hypothetical protein HPB50_018848 [Hyalomma asiaticum]|uniref:Uncharacterized protein n=1 Tax=Hyalomma asiaticum TaxID=266040 RepID=A0ACB7SGV3_HYAAI|nr:hypothetical protein HPB50_018848 [Hyalomma asiaticum]
MGPRKQYLGPINNAPNIPKSTRTYLQRCAFAQGTDDRRNGTDAVPGADVPCTHSDNTNAQQMVQDDSSLPEINSASPEALPVQSDNERSAQDLLLMVLNYALEFGLSWKAVEALQKLIVHVLDRHDIPTSNYLNELPPQMRCKNIFVSALWYGQSHPNMTLLVNSFVQQMRDLSANQGVNWMAGTRMIHSQVYCLSCCADALARASLQNFTQYNGHYGCGWCLHRGKTVDGTIKYPMDTTLNVKEMPKRSNNTWRRQPFCIKHTKA